MDFDGCYYGYYGFPDRAWYYVATIGGQVTSASYPYVEQVLDCLTIFEY